MELISNKADALKNKIRPGSIFVSKRTDNLKYIDQDGGECWVVQDISDDSTDMDFAPEPFDLDKAGEICETCKWFHVED